MDLILLIEYVINNPGAALFYSPLIKEDKSTILLKNPSKILNTTYLTEVKNSLKILDQIKNDFEYCYGYFAYEAGYAFEERLQNLITCKSEIPFLQFFCTNQFEKYDTNSLDHSSLKSIIQENNSILQNLTFGVNEKEYKQNIKQIKDYIKQGDTYQVNYTFKTNFDLNGDVKSFIASLIFNQSANYTSLINTGENLIISISPELFFKIENGKIISRPMKGTISRGKNLFEDECNKITLSNSGKDKAENTMIVDLIRNDLGKICKTGSVKFIDPFKIEKYESVYQMTSGVEGELINADLEKVFEAIFPCGSITGAPKIRTMEIINELEKNERGIYTGALGFISKEKTIFNIPIRTSVLSLRNNKGEIGIGSGIVWDSKENEEWKESLLKSNFLTKPVEYFEIFESMLVENNLIELQNYHLERMQKSAEYFLFVFERELIQEKIDSEIKLLRSDKKYKYKLLLSKWGEVNSDITEIVDEKNDLKITISDKQTDPNDKFMYFKTTNRHLYDHEFKNAQNNGFDEVLFFNRYNKLTEGAISNILIKLNGDLVTPSFNSGLLPGCFRKKLLELNLIKEKILTMDELLNAEEIFLINSVRKKRKVAEIFYNGKIIRTF